MGYSNLHQRRERSIKTSYDDWWGKQRRGYYSRSSPILITHANIQYYVLPGLIPPALYVSSGRIEGGKTYLACALLWDLRSFHSYFKSLICIVCCLWLSLLQHRDCSSPCLKSIYNLHPSHPAAPPLDAMALAISVGDTQDTEGRAD